MRKRPWHGVLGKTLLGSLLVLGQAQAGTMTRTSSFEYDAATGLLTKEVIEPDNAQLRLETSYTYDAYGNKVSATTSSAASGAAAVAPRTSGTTYDANGQFPVTSTNALGQSESRTYDARFGKVASLTGPNGLTTQWQYDSFGRKTREIRADGTQTKWEYLYCSGVNGGTTPCPSYGVYVVVTTPLASDGTTANGPWSKVYFDSLDREIKSETVGFDGSSIVAKDTQYDSLGRVSRSSLPYYANQTQQWSTVTYDALSRVVLTTAPDGSQSQTTYNGLTITVTNALNQTQTKVKNSQGQVIKVIDAQNNSLTYQYDAIGNMVATKDPNGNVVQLSYDLRGRKIGMVDPDMGTWSYEYNGFGELIRQTDAKGQVSTISYDKLGRMTSRSEPDLVSTWTYDNCAKGVGKLCSVSSDNGYQKTNSYDNLGRNVSTSTTIDTGYAEGVSYDANGRIATQTYPTGLVVKYVYTSLGYLKEVRNNQTNALLWRGDAQNAMGQLLQQTYGNNVVTQQVFEAATGRLKNIYAGAGNSVQNFSYQYDSLGNMVSRADGNQNLTETFLYDSLNRLTNAVVNSPQAGLSSTNYSYDALGNITNRSDMGSYVYGAVNGRPHALKELNFIHGGKLQYTYDANGALIAEVAVDSTGAVITDRGRTESYTSYGMLKTVSSPSVALSFVYGPDHQRIKQVAPSATTIYLNPDNTGGLFYEKDIKADGTVEHKHYITAGGSVIALIKQTGTTQTINYMHRDQLGSTTTITDESGIVIERLAYEPFGKRRQAGGATDSEGTVVGINTDRGFTNHEHLEELGLIHMNGRVYDPALGRFMSADPYIQAPDNIQSFNRYTYVFNQPLVMVDGSGYDAIYAFSSSFGSGGGSYYYGGSAGNWNGGFYTPQGAPNYRGTAPSSAKPAASAAPAPAPVPVVKPLTNVSGSQFSSSNAAAMTSAMSAFSQTTALFVKSVADSADKGVIGKAWDVVKGAAIGLVENAAADAHDMPMGGRGRELGLDMPTPREMCGGCDYRPSQILPAPANAEQELGRDLAPIASIVISGMRRPSLSGLSFGQMRIALETAQEAYKGSTAIGHALSKHAGRNPQIWGRMSGAMKTWNAQAMTHFREIVRAPGEFQEKAYDGLKFLEKRLEDGRGVRLNMDSTFKGFID